MNPGAVEQCNGMDDDCAGSVDEDTGCCGPSANAATTAPSGSPLVLPVDLALYLVPALAIILRLRRRRKRTV